MIHFGYIDAGTGSLFIQAVFGVFLAGIVVFRAFFRRSFGKLKQLVFKQKSVDEDK